MALGNKKRVIKVGVVALIGALSGILLALWNPLEKQQLYLSNFLYYERPTEHQVVVVSIDDRTVSSEGLGKFSSWCRTNYIPVLEKLASYEPAVIGLDILFLSKSEGLCQEELQQIMTSSDPGAELAKYADPTIHPGDLKLGEALRQIPNLVLLTRVVPASNEGRAVLDKNSYVQPPLAELTDDSTQSGHNRIMADSSGLIRYVIPAYLYQEKPVLAFSVKLIEEYLGMGHENTVEITPTAMRLTGLEKTLTVPLDDYRLQINYNEKPNLEARSDGNIVTIPFIDLYHNGEDFSDLIRGKIVLVGARFSSSEDRYQTPIDPTNAMFGVMIHAEAVQTILDRAWLRDLTFPERAAVILLLALAAAGLIFSVRISRALPLLAVLVVAYDAAAAPLLFRHFGLIPDMVYPPLTVILVTIIGYAVHYLSEFQQKNRVAGALGQYVNSEIARQVLQNDGGELKTGGEKRKLTVIFTDIRGFTTISESLQAQSVVALLNEYFEAMTEVVARNGGTIDKYEGDALMAFFLDEDGRTDQACRAAQAALDMRQALGKLKASWVNSGPLPGGEPKPDIDFRVGISTGEAVVGNIGSTRHLQFTVIGDIVNLGSRLESVNKKYHTSIMLAEASFEESRKAYECRFVDMIRVKGKEKPVKVYELICPKGQLKQEQIDLIQAYNKGLALYFQRDFTGALEVFQNEVFKRWPADYLSNLYAGRCELLKRFPPKDDWDFVYKMESK